MPMAASEVALQAPLLVFQRQDVLTDIVLPIKASLYSAIIPGDEKLDNIALWWVSAGSWDYPLGTCGCPFLMITHAHSLPDAGQKALFHWRSTFKPLPSLLWLPGWGTLIVVQSAVWGGFLRTLSYTSYPVHTSFSTVSLHPWKGRKMPPCSSI